MSGIWFPVRSRGFSVLEVLLVTSIVATLAAVSIPVTAGALDELRTSMAARYLEGRIMNARATAVKRSSRIGLRFESAGIDWRIGEYLDGNGNGTRSTLDPPGTPVGFGEPSVQRMHGYNAEPQTMPARFSTTKWSLILRVNASTPEVRRAALAELCEAYWYPLYSFARRRGADHDEASDLTQGFLVHLIEKNALSGVAQANGRFRSFLLASFKHFQSDAKKHGRALKRGGDRVQIPWDTDVLETRYRAAASSTDDPEKLFDRQWALTVIERARARLREEYASKGKACGFEVMLPYLTQHTEGRSQELAAALGTTNDAARVALYRMKRRFGAALRAEVASTVDDPEQIEAELRFLLQALGSSGRAAPAV